MLLFLLLLGLTLAAESPPDDQDVKLERGNCPMFWYSFSGRCYKYMATEMTWADAELFCLSEGANLVSIHSQEEQNFVQTLVQNFDHGTGPTWIGLSDIHKEGRWMWSDDCATHFFFWLASEPNNVVGVEHCAHDNHADEKKWNDLSCLATLPSVCASRIACVN